jgi:nucleoside-diphosphate-sugar epimerase|tara:strand:- start:806 stop:1663 length:858 start_codon:yes stop_codon:yes gene_type:complete
MKIALTGDKGFIGQRYFDLVNTDNEVFTYDLASGQDLKDKSVVDSMPDCDVVVHMAATNGTRLFYETPTEVTMNNTLPTMHIVDRYKDTPTKIVFVSSCEIFNGAVDKGLYNVPTDEQVPVMFDDITNPRWSYSIPKALGENLISNLSTHWLIIRYFNIYGPGQKDHFISEFVERVKQGEYYIKGNDTRSFCYVDDAVAMTHDLVMNVNDRIVNVGKQEESSIEDVAKCIMDVMGVDPTLLEIKDGPVGSVKRRCPDTQQLKALTGFEKYTSLQDGIRKTVESLL